MPGAESDVMGWTNSVFGEFQPTTTEERVLITVEYEKAGGSWQVRKSLLETVARKWDCRVRS